MSMYAMCVYIYIYMLCVCIYIYICICIHTYIHDICQVYLPLSLSSLGSSVRSGSVVASPLYTYMYNISIYIYIYMYVCMYIYMHIYIYILAITACLFVQSRASHGPLSLPTTSIWGFNYNLTNSD